ncbi:MAG TPA: lecithin retinol acyltransferase family protein [Anaeromyxobacter sp.]
MVGEHIRTRRDGRWTHGIDCGDGTVIHLDGPPGGARVRRSYRPEFVSGAELVEVVTHRERTFPPNEVVARAYSRIADAGMAAMFRDSEAFAEWCATGRLPAGPANVAILAPAPAASARAAPPVKAAQPAARAPSAGNPAAKAARPKARAKPKARSASKRAAAKRKPAKKKIAARGAKGRRS